MYAHVWRNCGKYPRRCKWYKLFCWNAQFASSASVSYPLVFDTVGMTLAALSLASLLASLAAAAPTTPQWTFDLKEVNSGIVALESIVVSPTLAIFFDRASNDPLQINRQSAWGVLWNLETSTVQPLDVLTSSLCASGALLSNGTMVCFVPRPRPYYLHYLVRV